ncbi:hypothetical protein TUM20903_36660 [Citrobacter koseri]|nr:hypothetical protein TUM13189_36880 [Citrobacter koseri]BDG90928.1 hypothetical protein TUM20903_36660 [Citrobacter koseri]
MSGEKTAGSRMDHVRNRIIISMTSIVMMIAATTTVIKYTGLISIALSGSYAVLAPDSDKRRLIRPALQDISFARGV